MRPTRMLAIACGLAGTATLTALLAAPAAMATDAQTGSAFAISVDAKLLNALSVKIDPQPKAAYPAGADKSAVKVDALKKLNTSVKVLNAASNAKDGVLTSTASTVDVEVLGLVKAKVLEATCVADGKTITGNSKLVDVWVAGHQIDVSLTGKIQVTDVVTVWLNEKVATNDGLTVNALRVSVGGQIADVAKADIILSQAKCSGPGDIVDEPGDGGPTTTTTAPATTTTTKPGDGGPTSSVTPAPSSTTSGSATTSSSAGAGNGGNGGNGDGVTPVADSSNLPDTGANAIVPLSIGGALLVAGGGAAVWMTRRRMAAAAAVTKD